MGEREQKDMSLLTNANRRIEKRMREKSNDTNDSGKGVILLTMGKEEGCGPG